MKGRRPRGTLVIAVLVLVGAVGVAAAVLGDGGDDPSPRPREPQAEDVATIDWRRPAAVDVGEGWALRDEEGEGPFVAVVRDGRRVGAIEIAEFPLESLPEVSGAVGRGERAALDAHVDNYLQIFASEREQGCGEGYRFQPDRTVHQRAADGAVVRYGFRGTLPDGQPSERHVQWAGIRGRFLVVLTAAAYDARGCPGTEGGELTTAALDAFAPVLEQVVLASRFPSPPA